MRSRTGAGWLSTPGSNEANFEVETFLRQRGLGGALLCPGQQVVINNILAKHGQPDPGLGAFSISVSAFKSYQKLIKF